jgi:hypothetical protein
MLQSLLSLMTTKPLDVQIWECDPLIVVMTGNEVAYAHRTKIEFTPFDSTTMIGHGLVLTPDHEGVCPEIAAVSRQYIDMPVDGFVFARRQGIILMGTDQFQAPVTWYINGAADNFLNSPPEEGLVYDEEIGKILEEELEGEPEKFNLNSVF